jgi:hypothetical protein
VTPDRGETPRRGLAGQQRILHHPACFPRSTVGGAGAPPSTQACLPSGRQFCWTAGRPPRKRIGPTRERLYL